MYPDICKSEIGLQYAITQSDILLHNFSLNYVILYPDNTGSSVNTFAMLLSDLYLE